MNNSERQKKLAFVLQLLEDLRLFHGSNIHKCGCEICDKKSSLIHSSIAKATEEVSQVSLSLSFQKHGNLTEGEEEGMSGGTTRQNNLIGIGSSITPLKQSDSDPSVTKTAPTSNALSSPFHVSPVFYNQFPNFPCTTSSPSQPVPPAYGWIPAGFYPLSLLPNRNLQSKDIENDFEEVVNKGVNGKEGTLSYSPHVDDNVNHNLLFSPCKKKRRSRNSNPSPCDSDSSDSTDDISIGHAVIKSPCKKAQRNVTSFESDSELDSFDAGVGLGEEFADHESSGTDLETIDFAPSQRNDQSNLRKGSSRSSSSGLDSILEESSKSNTSLSPMSNSRRKSKCRQSLFGLSEAYTNNSKENRESSSPARGDGHSSKSQDEMMRDISNYSFNQRNLSGERKEIIDDKSYSGTKKMSKKSDSSFGPPEIIVTNADSVETDKMVNNNNIAEIEKKLKSKLLGEGIVTNDKSMLELLVAQKESHSFCTVPNHHDNSHNVNTEDNSKASSCCKKGRVAMKTFPPQRKTKRVYARSTQDSSQDKPTPKTFPVMGTTCATNKLQTLQAVNDDDDNEDDDDDNGSKDEIFPDDDADCGQEEPDDLIKEIDEIVSGHHQFVHENENHDEVTVNADHPKVEMEKKKKKGKEDCQHSSGEIFGDRKKAVHVDGSEKNCGSLTAIAAPAWGAPAVWHSHGGVKDGREEEVEEEELKNNSVTLKEDAVSGGEESKAQAGTCPGTPLWRRFGKLHLNTADDSSNLNLNQSLPVSKWRKALQGQGPNANTRGGDGLESFEANQSFPRMAEGQRSDALVAAGPAVPGITVGAQNLALGDIHQNSSTPSTLRGADRGLAPRNRRSIFGFSPPSVVSPRSSPSGKPDQMQNENEGQEPTSKTPNSKDGMMNPQWRTMMSPQPLVDEVWAAFDVSHRFHRPPQLEEVLFNCVTSCVCVVDTRMQGKIVSVNEAFQQLVGIHERMLGLRLSRFIKVRTPPSELAVSSPQQVVLSDGTLTPVSGKLVSCITDRGGEVPVSMWLVPSCLSPASHDVKLCVCVIELVVPLPDGFYLTKDGQITFDTDVTDDVVLTQSLTPCRWTTHTGLIVVDSDGRLTAWDNAFFGQCDIEKKSRLSKYLSEVVKISDSNDSTTDSSSSADNLGGHSPLDGGHSSPSSRNHLLSRFGGEVGFLKESAVLWTDTRDDDTPGLLLPARCFLMDHDGFDADEEGDVLLSGGGVEKDGKREETSFSEEAAAAESLKHVHGSHGNGYKQGGLPTTSTPCKNDGQAVLDSHLAMPGCYGQAVLDSHLATPGCFRGDEDVRGSVELDKGIYSAKFHNSPGEHVDVTFKLGKVETVENGTLFCLWFSIQEEGEDALDDDDDEGYLEIDDVDEEAGNKNDNCRDDNGDDDNGPNGDGNDSNDKTSQTLTGGGGPALNRLNQIRNEGVKDSKKADVSLGQFITDQASGLNQSLNATVGEDTLDLEQAVVGSFSDSYKILETLGQGSFGFVRRAFPLAQEHNSVVVKFIKKSSMLEDSWQWQTSAEDQIPMEVAILQRLDHQNIVKLLDIHQNAQFVQLVMEDFASLDLFDFIDQVSVDQTLACHIFKQIVHAVDYLHSHSILHRDIKDENVIINSSFHCKLIDFGSATTFLPQGQLFDKFRGTLEYCSPEVHLHQRYRGPELDVWALGVTLYTVVFRENPYRADLIPHQMDVNDLPWPVHHELADVLFGLLCCDLKERWSVSNALASPWLQWEVDLARYNWDDLFSHPDIMDY